MHEIEEFTVVGFIYQLQFRDLEEVFQDGFFGTKGQALQPLGKEDALFLGDTTREDEEIIGDDGRGAPEDLNIVLNIRKIGGKAGKGTGIGVGSAEIAQAGSVKGAQDSIMTAEKGGLQRLDAGAEEVGTRNEIAGQRGWGNPAGMTILELSQGLRGILSVLITGRVEGRY